MNSLAIDFGFPLLILLALLHFYFKNYLSLILFSGNFFLFIFLASYPEKNLFLESLIYAFIGFFISLYIGLNVKFDCINFLKKPDWSRLSKFQSNMLKFSLLGATASCVLKLIFYGP